MRRLFSARFQRHNLLVDGIQRTYRLYVPSATHESAPLVIALHGGSGNSLGMQRLTHFNDVADHEGFIVVYPDGLHRQWNDRRGSGRRMRTSADDVAFISALIDHLATIQSIDLNRVYVTGISNGGMMSYRLVCNLSERIAGIAAVTANMSADMIQECVPSRPVPVLIINGTDDPMMPYHGGKVTVGMLQLGEVASTDETVAFWVAKNGCADTPIKAELPDIVPDDGTRVYRYNYTGGDARVTLLSIEGGGHTWPGGPQYLPMRTVGRVCRDIDASEVIWAFFAGQ